MSPRRALGAVLMLVALLAIGATLHGSAAVPSLRAAPTRSFVVRDDAFVKDGAPFVLRSGLAGVFFFVLLRSTRSLFL